MKNTDLKQAEIWGRVFEIAVQRGVLAYLRHQDLLHSHHPQLIPWQEYRISHLTKHLYQTLQDETTLAVRDENIKTWIDAYLRHFLVLGYGLGWTALRECLTHQPGHQKMQLEALWCPLTLPGVTDPRDRERRKTARQFNAAFGLSGFADTSLVDRGQPGRADFLLWLSTPDDAQRSSQPIPDLILCFEFSYNASFELADFSLEATHCQQINRYARYLDARGSFSRICAEVQGDRLQISSQLNKHLVAFSGRDKPLYKLCQASSYTEKLVALLQNKKRLQKPCIARAMAITSNGLESLSACFGGDADPRIELMQSLGTAYREMKPLETPADLDQKIRDVFKKLLSSLPTSELRKQAAANFQFSPNLTQDLQISLTEAVTGFHRPADLFEQSDILAAIEETEALQGFFGSSPRSAIEQQLQKLAVNPHRKSSLSLRDAHKATIRAGLASAQPGRLKIIALEGNPGIGKTTSVVSFLKEQSSGFLFLYVSPRVVINRSVTQDLAQDKGEKTGILTLTANSKLISSASQWYKQQIQSQGWPTKTVDSAVVIDGVSSFKNPQISTIFVTPEQEQEIDDEVVTSNRYKTSLNERDEQMNNQHRPGVLRTLAVSARFLLENNPKINQIVLTAATQGYRNLTRGTTINALNNLFAYRVDSRPGIGERKAFSQRIPHILVMVDEVAGDGAGALFVHEIAKWLHQQFIKPFDGSPFQVTLIIADASLSNEVVLNNFLNSGDRVPDKVLISPSQGDAPFRVTGTQLKIGGKKYPTLHVLSNSFPASALRIDYSIRLSAVTPELTDDGKLKSMRAIIRSQAQSVLLNNAFAEIKKALEHSAQQIIFFAQDKAFLRDLKAWLTTGNKKLLNPQVVAVLDHSVPPSKRLELVSEPKRDQIRLFLMTSSGARGVSFPKADWIIASFPRFSVEASLMEIAQLIYRGRGRYTDPKTQQLCSGEAIERRLVLLINDFVLQSEQIDEQRQWLRRSSDLLTLLLMLRSTIYTRIKGDAGLRRQPLAFVPVGKVGDEELLRLMSDDVQDFRQEARIFLRDEHHSDLKKAVGQAEKLVCDLFKDLDLIGQTQELQLASYSDYRTLEALAKGVSRLSSRLLPNLEPETQIPPHLSCLGPFWWEDWRSRNVREQYNFSDCQEAMRNAKYHLLKILNKIQKDKAFPKRLRDPACELHKLLIREKTEQIREYSTLQAINTQNLIVALPLDYPQFWRRASEPEEIQIEQQLEDAVTWRESLGRTLSSQSAVLPVIAQYRRFPWVAIAGRQSISQLEQVFDNRYFLASSELNFLNALLFHT
ncbi:MAG: hypothetical protein SAJ12_00490 [Jaaginema sp. PMC 1079.18]|nr:hypothetical protein [Jaaginema sp. PMC 1080.18]MEC4849461.1 hypothetical protein [Jaaginema sp. PMC 1079.18]MEC4865440.1 hypothetical protein [Jaaginema sp. PMC 1078.18]